MRHMLKVAYPFFLAATFVGCKAEPQKNPTGKNIFAETERWYVNEWWSLNAEYFGGESISQHNTGLWLDKIRTTEEIPAGTILGLSGVEDGISPSEGFGLREHLLDAESQGNALVQLVIHNLPGRDCWAERSFGELPASDFGMRVYREEFIDRIARILKEFPHIPIALIIEPNSALYLSNQYIPESCYDVDNSKVFGYVNGVRYAINTFSQLQNAYIYLDAGSASKFGWDDGLYYATLFTHGILTGFNGLGDVAQSFVSDIETGTGGGWSFDIGALFIEPSAHPKGGTEPPGYNKISGFITNVRDYVPLEEPFLGTAKKFEGESPLRSAWFYDWNPRFGELEYAEDWLESIASISSNTEHLGALVDTSRNGWGQGYQMVQPSAPIQDSELVDEYRIDRRPYRRGWCNQVGAGLGHRPQATPDGQEWLHAYVWSKPPGESDGNSKFLSDNNFPDQPYIAMCAPEGVNLEAERWEVTAGLGIATGAWPDAYQQGTWHEFIFAELLKNAWPPICNGKGDKCLDKDL